jgi:hypothetical protein
MAVVICDGQSVRQSACLYSDPEIDQAIKQPFHGQMAVLILLKRVLADILAALLALMPEYPDSNRIGSRGDILLNPLPLTCAIKD